MTSASISSSRTIDDARPPRAASELAILAVRLLVVLAFVLTAGVAAARDWPAPTGYLNDFAKVVDPASADSIEALAKELAQKTGAEIAVVTIPDLGGEEIEPAATDLFSHWGIGSKAKDEGVLILLALKERRIRIEPGYGVEGVLPDGRAGGIIRRVMGPDLSADRFGPGLLKGARAVAAVIATEHGVTLTGTEGVQPPPLRDDEDRLGIPGIFLLLFILVVFIVLSSVFNAMTRGRRGWRDWPGRRGRWYGPFGGGFGGMGGLGGFGGGGGSFGGGGGFGGFGGGSSGGGGASGRF